MGLPQTKESRRHHRFEVHRLPGPLLNAATMEPISCQAVDVSAEGMGIVSSEWIPPQLDVILLVDEEKIALEIVWGVEKRGAPTWARKNAEENEPQVYRYGLRLTAPDKYGDLAEVFTEKGCFD